MIQLAASKTSDNQFTIKTVGLTSTIGHPEVRVEVRNPGLMEEAESFLRYVANQITMHEMQIRPGETMAYGYWLVKFEEGEAETLETWEHDAEGMEFVKGVDQALIYWRDQHWVCSLYSAEFKAPRAKQLTVVSEGVLDGLPLKAVRYPSPDHMSGWWLVTELYDGNIKSLKNEHTFHVTAARPELAKFLALPNGFRFHSHPEKVWFDEEVANATT
jgi:hypothetical protein